MSSISRSDLSASTSNSSQTVLNKERISTPDSNRGLFTYSIIVEENKNDEEKRKRSFDINQLKFKRHGVFKITSFCCCIWIAALLAVIWVATIFYIVAQSNATIIDPEATTSTLTSTTLTTTTMTISTSVTTSASTTSTSTTSTSTSSTFTTSSSITSTSTSSTFTTSSSTTSTSSTSTSTSSTSTTSTSTSSISTTSTSTTSSSTISTSTTSILITSTSTTSTSTTSSSTTSTSTTSSSTISTSTTSTTSTSTSSTSISTTSSSTTSTSTTSTTTSTTFTTSTSTTSTTTTSTSTTSTSTTSTTTPYDSCINLYWNQRGVVVCGNSEGRSAHQLNNPTCLYIDGKDTLYICDCDNNRIQMWTQGATDGVTVAGSSAATAGSTSTLLKSPEDVVFDKDGYMYVADRGNHRVQRFHPSSLIGTTVAGTTTKSSALTDLDNLAAIDVDDNFNVYTLDTHNKRVIQWAPEATSGTVLISSHVLDGAHDILLVPGSWDEVYISDKDDNKIYLWKFFASSPILTLSAVSTGCRTLKKPRGMALDLYGNLYVADSDNNRVVMYCAGLTVGIVVAVDTTPQIHKPIAVALDWNLNLYVAIAKENKVIKFPRL